MSRRRRSLRRRTFVVVAVNQSLIELELFMNWPTERLTRIPRNSFQVGRSTELNCQPREERRFIACGASEANELVCNTFARQSPVQDPSACDANQESRRAKASRLHPIKILRGTSARRTERGKFDWSPVTIFGLFVRPTAMLDWLLWPANKDFRASSGSHSAADGEL